MSHELEHSIVERLRIRHTDEPVGRVKLDNDAADEIERLMADNATLRTALHTQAEEAAKLIEQRDELVCIAKRIVSDDALGLSADYDDIKALRAAINKATNTTN